MNRMSLLQLGVKFGANFSSSKKQATHKENAESFVSSFVTVEYVSTRCVIVVRSWTWLFAPVKKISSWAWSKTGDYECPLLGSCVRCFSFVLGGFLKRLLKFHYSDGLQFLYKLNYISLCSNIPVLDHRSRFPHIAVSEQVSRLKGPVGLAWYPYYLVSFINLGGGVRLTDL